METTKAQKMPNWALSKQKFGQFLEGMRTSEFMAIDTESNGKDLRYEDGTGKTMGLSVAFRIAEPFEIRTAYFPFRHWDWNYPTEYLTRLKEVIETYEGKTGPPGSRESSTSPPYSRPPSPSRRTALVLGSRGLRS